MNPPRRPARAPSQLSISLTRSLNAYALGACATGVAFLALASPSEAEVIYTPAHVVIGRDGSYGIDLNHDGIVDYRIVELGGGGGVSHYQSLDLDVLGNYVACNSSPGCLDFTTVAALPAGVQIGYNGFWEHHYRFGLANAWSFTGKTYYLNLFQEKSNHHYLALRFQVEEETHYGWARLTIRFVGTPPKDGTWQATLTGYAYESVPNKPLISGQTSGTGDGQLSSASAGTNTSESKHPGSLGSLSLGK